MKKDEKEKEDYRVLSAIASTLPPSETRALLLSSTQNLNKQQLSNIPSTSSITVTSTNKTSKRRANIEQNSNIEPLTKRKKR